VRIAVALLMLVFNEAATLEGEGQRIIRLTALAGLFLCGPYYAAILTGVALRAQAYLRMFGDVALMTLGLYAAGGLGAAQYVAGYTVVPVYTGIVFSSRACLLATLFATVAYLTVALLQSEGALPMTRPAPPNAWEIAAFNLLVLNIVGVLAALLAEAYRASRYRLAALNVELEQAHDELLRLNAHIQRASRRYVLGEVVAGVVHEIRNVLQGAFGHLWLARRGLRSPPADLVEHLDQIEHACESAMRIIRTTLDMARQRDAGGEPVALADVVHRVVQLKGFELRRDGIALGVDVADDLPRVVAAPFQLQQVLLNLVANAQDALRTAPGAREIAIVAEPDDAHAVVEVRDTGPGIPLAVLPHIFEPFFTTKDSGTGLGLAISAGIVEGLGGTLTATNRPGGGAVFRLALPAGATTS